MKKSHLLSLPLFVAVSVALLSTTPLIGQSLEVRRAQKAFLEELLPEKLTELQEAIGIEIPFEFDAESIQAAENPVRVYESLPAGALNYIVMALSEVGSDDLGKEVLGEKVSKVLFVHTTDPDLSGISMDEDGVVKVSMDGTSATSEIAYSALKEFLEKNL